MPDGAGPGLRVLAPGEAPVSTPAAPPVAVRRSARSPSFHGWRVSAAAPATVEVFAACYVENRPLAASFPAVRLEPDREYVVDASSEGRWRLLDGAQRRGGAARPPGGGRRPERAQPAAVEHALQVSVVGPRQRTARTAATSSRTPARIAGSGICP